MDDDTFIFTDRLNEFISKYDKNEPLYIGNRCESYSFPIYMCGGSGFLLTKPLYLSLIQFIRQNREDELVKSIYGDLLIGLWLTDLKKTVIEINAFNSTLHKNDDELNTCISFHYLKNEDHYKFYKLLIDK
jgi:hypothetical protein